MVQIDPTNTAIVGLDLFPVAERHQDALIEAIVQKQIPSWASNPYFQSASVHRSFDGVRVFTYSQWTPKFDYRSLSRPTVFGEFYPPDSLLLEVSASKSLTPELEIVVGGITHLAEFRMMPANQAEMVKRTTAEVARAIGASGLLSATFHRSLDGTRMFNYGRWESQGAFETFLKQPPSPEFDPDRPYWDGLARNEFHLYNVVHVEATAA